MRVSVSAGALASIRVAVCQQVSQAYEPHVCVRQCVIAALALGHSTAVLMLVVERDRETERQTWRERQQV